MQDESDSGATHAADIAATSALPGPRSLPSRGPNSPSGLTGKRTAATGQYPRARQTPPPGGRATPAPPPAAGRFCGTCGARLEPGSAFCGQCGTPVTTSGVHSTKMRATSAGPGFYRASAGGAWDEADEADGDARTVAELPMEQVFGGGGYADYAPADDNSRTQRLIFGVLCLIGSFVLAVAAIVLAIATFSH
jgi:zinc ribbon protein